MPDESCRNCGGELINCTLCAECRNAVSMICIRCGKRTIEQVHALCFLSEIPKINESESISTGIFYKHSFAA